MKKKLYFLTGFLYMLHRHADWIGSFSYAQFKRDTREEWEELFGEISDEDFDSLFTFCNVCAFLIMWPFWILHVLEREIRWVFKKRG